MWASHGESSGDAEAPPGKLFHPYFRSWQMVGGTSQAELEVAVQENAQQVLSLIMTDTAAARTAGNWRADVHSLTYSSPRATPTSA